MEDLIAYLKQKGVDRSFAELGLDLFSQFPENKRQAATRLYGQHEWLVKKIAIYGTVINAVPPDDQIERLPWEEWYVLEGKNHHHVLYLKKPAAYDELFEAPDADDIHPPRTLGKNWYVIDDPDMSPVLLR
jgi:hypothetical protein